MRLHSSPNIVHMKKSLGHRPRPRVILILSNGLPTSFDKLDMTRGWGQWLGVTGRTGWSQCALLLEKSVYRHADEVLTLGMVKQESTTGETNRWTEGRYQDKYIIFRLCDASQLMISWHSLKLPLCHIHISHSWAHNSHEMDSNI